MQAQKRGKIIFTSSGVGVTVFIGDVYKRQSKTYKFSDINYAVASREDKEAMFLEYSEPVSYTHLDVYKRQGSAAKNIAILLASVLKQEISQSNKTRGKARLTNMIKSCLLYTSGRKLARQTCL